MAFDNNSTDILITGDFSLDMLKSVSHSKITRIASHYGLEQLISEPTHFTESSSSIIDLFFTSNSNIVTFSGVGEHVLDQTVRYHCPVFCFLNISKPVHLSFKRLVWQFHKGNYDLLRTKVNSFDWSSIVHENIDTYSDNFTSQLLTFCKDSIPNKYVTIRKSQPSWMRNNIRTLIRKRKRAYDKAK